MIYIGIDPGLDGGVAVLNSADSRLPLILHKTPVIAGKDYDVQQMKEILLAVKNTGAILFATIENQISMPGQGLTSTLQTGKGFGIWLGLLAGLEIPHQVISARQWQGKMFTGVKASLDTKAKSEIVAKRLFPSADFRKSDRARIANDGLTDAACIAEYGRRLHLSVRESVEIEPQAKYAHTASTAVPDICTKCGRHTGDGLGCIIPD